MKYYVVRFNNPNDESLEQTFTERNVAEDYLNDCAMDGYLGYIEEP